MELKDVVLQAINEMDEVADEKGALNINGAVNDGEMEFLLAFKERIFVLFEGIKIEGVNDSSNKDIILGFLQFQLALIDSRIEVLEKRLKG